MATQDYGPPTDIEMKGETEPSGDKVADTKASHDQIQTPTMQSPMKKMAKTEASPEGKASGHETARTAEKDAETADTIDSAKKRSDQAAEVIHEDVQTMTENPAVSQPVIPASPVITTALDAAAADPSAAFTPHTAAADPSAAVTPHTAAADPSAAVTPHTAAADPSAAVTPHTAAADPSAAVTPHTAAADPSAAVTPHTAAAGPSAAVTPHTAAADPSAAFTLHTEAAVVTPQVIQPATPQVVEAATPQVIEATTPVLAPSEADMTPQLVGSRSSGKTSGASPAPKSGSKFSLGLSGSTPSVVEVAKKVSGSSRKSGGPTKTIIDKEVAATPEQGAVAKEVEGATAMETESNEDGLNAVPAAEVLVSPEKTAA